MRELHSSGKHWPAMKPLLLESFSECGNSTMAKHKLTTIYDSKDQVSYYQNKVIVRSVAFTKSSTLASSGVKENVFPNNMW